MGLVELPKLCNLQLALSRLQVLLAFGPLVEHFCFFDFLVLGVHDPGRSFQKETESAEGFVDGGSRNRHSGDL